MTRSASFVSLHDPETCWKDPQAKSIGYFTTRDQACLTMANVAEIKKMAQESGDNVRLSMHQGQESEFHEMIIYQHRDKYYRPKKHIGKAKSFHMIEGEMAVFVFADDGTVIDACVLDGKDAIMYRVEANLFHTDVPLTEYVVHHESTLGPFLGDDDRVFAPFSPDGSDKNAYLAYRDDLLKLVGR